MQKYLLCVVAKINDEIKNVRTFNYIKDDEGKYYLPYDLQKWEEKYFDYLWSWETYEVLSSSDGLRDNGYTWVDYKFEGSTLGIKSIPLF